MSESPKTPPTGPADPDRRSDLVVRAHIRELLALIRDFYSTCHMVAVGQLSPAKAKEKAHDVEVKLNVMMQNMLERIDDLDGDGGEEE